MKASGKTTSSAPSPAASAVNRSSFSSVASRSRTTGSAWTQAALTARSIAGILRSELADSDREAARCEAGLAGPEGEAAALHRTEPEHDAADAVRAGAAGADAGP